MSRRRLSEVLGARLPRREDDRGSMAMLLMVILVSVTLGGLMLAMILNQDGSTRFSTSRVLALDAAQSGIDVMLGEIRASTAVDANGNSYGNDGQLPCDPITGNPNGTGSVTYQVSVTYYVSDPAASGATPMTCSPGYGPYDPSSTSHTPHYAVITSTGTGGSTASSTTKGRTLTTTYVVRTDDANIPGGQIQIYPDSSGNKWCWDAGSATPSPGTPILLRACSTSRPPIAQQVFAYRSDLSIQLVSSVTPTRRNGLCIDTNPTDHAPGRAIVLEGCTPLGSAPWNRQWSVDDAAHLRGSNTAATNTDGYCIDAAAQTDGQALTLQPCAGGVTDTAQTWVPSPTAGAGMAGAANNQIVNYLNFATCLDVTGQNVNSTFLILYTCKQNPNPANVAWNQKFVESPALGNPATAPPATVTLHTTYHGIAYCLQSPLTSGGYVIVTPSCLPNSANTFTWYQTKDSSGGNLPYAQVYTIVDSSGLCLSPGPSSDLLNGQYLKAVVATCTGGTAQKWNADPSVLAARLTNTAEKRADDMTRPAAPARP